MLYNVRTEISFICYSVSPAVVIWKTPVLKYWDWLFVLQDYDKLSNFVAKYYKTSLEKIDLSIKGWNWGAAQFKGFIF